MKKDSLVFIALGAGEPFGSKSQFVKWYGPLPEGGNLSGCDETNALYYLKANGMQFFGGSSSLAPAEAQAA